MFQQVCIGSQIKLDLQTYSVICIKLCDSNVDIKFEFTFVLPCLSGESSVVMSSVNRFESEDSAIALSSIKPIILQKKVT